MKRIVLIAVLALLTMAAAPTPPMAGGDLASVALIFSGLALAQLLEGAIVGLAAMRKLGRNGLIVLLFFGIAIWATWLFVFSPGGFDRTLSELVSTTRMSPDAAGAVIDVSFWLLMLLAGPIAALIAGLVMGRFRRHGQSA